MNSTSETSASKKKNAKAHCNSCQKKTNHWIRASYTERGEDDHAIVWWVHEFEILQCCGCDEVKFRRSEQFSEDVDYEETITGEVVPVLAVKEIYYPPAVWRAQPRWLSKLENKEESLARLLEEVYTALHADSLFLAGMGTRTLIERVLTKTVGDNGSFRKKLELLSEKGLIASKDVEAIETALEAGHASTHRGWRPNRDQLETVMNIIENLLERVFILSDSAKKLRPKIPSRNSKLKPKKTSF